MTEFTIPSVLTNQCNHVDEPCSGGVVHQRCSIFDSHFLINVSIPPSTFAWYESQWRTLVRRLRYPNSPKALKARKKILLYWGPNALNRRS